MEIKKFREEGQSKTLRYMSGRRRVFFLRIRNIIEEQNGWAKIRTHFSAAWTQCESLKRDDLQHVAGNLFWDYVNNFIGSGNNDEIHPIDLKGSLAAFEVSGALSLGLWAFAVTTGSVLDWRTATLLLALPLLFIGHILFGLSLKLAAWGLKNQMTPRVAAINWWHRLSYPKPGVSIVQYNASTHAFEFNPALYRLLTANRFLFIVTNLVIYSLFIELHESLHEKGLQKEWQVFGIQSAVYMTLVALTLYLPIPLFILPALFVWWAFSVIRGQYKDRDDINFPVTERPTSTISVVYGRHVHHDR
jgi:hypothetical protein